MALAPKIEKGGQSWIQQEGAAADFYVEQQLTAYAGGIYGGGIGGSGRTEDIVLCLHQAHCRKRLDPSFCRPFHRLREKGWLG